MNTEYKIVLTSAQNSLNCEAEYIKVKTSLTAANEAIFAQKITDILSDLYAKQGREMLCVWEMDAAGNESAFYQ